MAYASGGSKYAAARVGQSNGLDDSRMGNSNRWPARLYRSFSVMPWSAAKVGLASKHSLHIIGCWLFPQCTSAGAAEGAAFISASTSLDPCTLQ